MNEFALILACVIMGYLLIVVTGWFVTHSRDW